MPKILLIRFSSIGDIVLTTPVPRNIKKQVKDAEIHYCTKNTYIDIIRNNPYIDKSFALNDSLNDLANELRKENYDYVLDLHHNFRTLRLKIRLGLLQPNHKTQFFSFNKLNLEKWLYVNFKADKMPNLHIVDRYMETAKVFGIENDQQGLDFFIPPKDEIPLSALPDTHQQGYVAYAMGAQHNTKKLPLPKMIELCQKINSPIVLLGDKHDAEIAKEIVSYFEKQANEKQTNEKQANEKQAKPLIFNACGKFNLNQSASLLKQAQLVFAHDTGLMHIAAALKKTVYSIWGNTTPALGMFPYQTPHKIIENKEAKCRPCSKIGFDSCPKKHFACMNGIKFDFE